METSLCFQRQQQGHDTFVAVLDEYGTSKRHSKLGHALTEQRVDKFNPAKGREATTVRADGTTHNFTIAKDRHHKLLAWYCKLADGTKRLIVANRDEATCTNYLLIYVHAFLGKLRPHHLSRISSLCSNGKQPATPQSSGRGLCGLVSKTRLW